MYRTSTYDLTRRYASNEPVAVREVALFRVLAPSELRDGSTYSIVVMLNHNISSGELLLHAVDRAGLLEELQHWARHLLRLD